MRTKLQPSGFTELHIPCPCGHSSDAFCLRPDGSGWCFSCNKNITDSTGGNVISIEERNEANAIFRHVPQRGISETTMRFYDAKTKIINDELIEIGFPYPNGGLKVRSLKEKTFRSQGNMRAPGLFGKDKFDPGSKKSITITEGEYDAMSIYTATNGNTAAVSVTSAGTARRDCTQDRDYINSFDRIILCFDNDEPGQAAAQDVSALFDFNRVYHVRFNRHKDANEYLKANEGHDLFKAWDGAKRYSPDNIISTFKEIELSLLDSKEDKIGDYPFSGLSNSLYGLHRGEVVVLKGPSGIGKTEVFRAIEHHLLKTTKSNIGIIHLEEDNATTVKAIAGYELGLPATLPDSGLSNEDILTGYKQAVGGDDRRVHIYSSFEIENENKFLDNIRFLAVGAGCDFVFFDHITWMGTGLEKEDERLKLDRLSQKLKLLAKELRICLIMISHTNDEGRTRGSRNIENVANTMIHINRDKENSNSLVSKIMDFTVVKARLGGHTGPAGRAILDPDTHKLRDMLDTDFLIPTRK